MRVRDAMTENVAVCGRDTNLSAATEMMWNANCGILPVVENFGRAVGVITDRDICIAAGTRGCPASEIAVKDVISGNVFACSADSDIGEALETMRSQKVRRLLVVDGEGRVEGILSLDDLAIRAQEIDGGDKPELSLADVALTLKAISDRSWRQQAHSLAAHY